MIAGVEPNKKMSPIVTELFLRGRKFNISPFIWQFYFKVHKAKIKWDTLFYDEKTQQDNFFKETWIICLTLSVKISWSFKKIILNNHFHF